MNKLLVLLAVWGTPLCAQRFQVGDLFRITGVSDPQLAPDGKSIVIVVARPNITEDRYDTELVSVDVATGTQRELTAAGMRGVSSPRWAPNGESLGFLANDGTGTVAKKQVFVLPRAGGEARRITDAPQGVQQFAWSPDGRTFAFVTSDEPAKKAGEDTHNLSFELGDDGYLLTSAALPLHVWLVPTAGGAARRLTSGEWSVPVSQPPGPPPSPLAWSPDGRSIAINHLVSPHTGDSDKGWIELVDIAGGSARKLTGNAYMESLPQFSPDGSRIAYTFPREGGRANFNDIWIVPQGGAEGTDITSALDINVARGVWMTGGKSLVVGGRTETGVGLWSEPAAGGAATRLNLGSVEPWCAFWLDVTTSADGALAFTALTPTQPRELYYMASVDAKPRQLTNFNGAIAALNLGRAETVTWDFEGNREDGVLVYPPDFDPAKKYPLVLYIHGGPRGSSTLGFSANPQLFAAQGWMVFMPNYRGSDNLGQAYALAINRDSGAGPGRDVMAGLGVVEGKGFVDESRVALCGWSYGGYMTAWLAGHYPDFCAAAMLAPVTNLVDQYTLGDNNVRYAFPMGGSPYSSEAQMRLFIEQSPITYASHVKVPTLIMSDTADPRVTVTQSFQFYHALRDNGVTAKFIAYPVYGHIPEDPVNVADISRRYVDWFATYLK